MVKIMENPIKMDDLGVPLFLETPVYDPSTKPLYEYVFFAKEKNRATHTAALHLTCLRENKSSWWLKPSI